MEKQISLFATMAEKDQEAMIKKTVEESKNWKTMIDDILAAWKTGDGPALKKLVADSIGKHPKLHKKLPIDRNESWLEKIEELLQGGKDAIVIVGAAHLVGKDSVLDLLRKKGVLREATVAGAKIKPEPGAARISKGAIHVDWFAPRSSSLR